MSFLKRLQKATNKRFLGDGGTSDRAAEMEDKHFSLTLALHSLSQWEHWEPTMGTFLIISAALLHYYILTSGFLHMTDCFRLLSVLSGSSA